MARRSFFDRVRDFFRPAPKQAPPPPPVAPLPTRPSRNQPPPPPAPRQAPRQLPTQPSRTHSARTLGNYNGWRQVRIMSNTEGDTVNFIKSLPANNLVIVVGYGEAKGGDSYSAGTMGWMTIQSKMYADEVNDRGRVAHRRAGFAQFAEIETLIVRYGSVRTLERQDR